MLRRARRIPISCRQVDDGIDSWTISSVQSATCHDSPILLLHLHVLSPSPCHPTIQVPTDTTFLLEQETLLTNLSARETTQNKQYVLSFSILPLAVVLAFLRILALSTTKSMTLACLLSITSLLSSAYIMYFVPTGTPLFALVTKTRARLGLGSTTPASVPHPQRLGQRQLFTIPSLTKSSPQPPDLDTPLALVLPYFNALLCILVALVALRYRGSSDPDIPQGLWMVFLLPAVVFAVVLVVRNSINDIQSGLGELRGLRYEFKGA